jgi:hypothetical protein
LFKLKSLVLPVMLLFVLVLSLAVSACGGEKSTSATTPAAPTISTSSSQSTAATTSPAPVKPVTTTASAPASTTVAPSKPPANTQTTAASGSGLAALLSKSANVAMKFDMVTTGSVSGTPIEMTATVWQKGGKMKMESIISGMETTTYINTADQSAIVYMPAQNMAIKTSVAQAGISQEDSDISSIMKYNPTEAGTETLDGKLCTIITYTTPEGASKTWIWQEKGLPLKEEVDTAQGKAVITFQNYDFSAIADSEFDLPAGVQVTDMGSIKIPSQP